jgi:hypothetical protein
MPVSVTKTIKLLFEVIEVFKSVLPKLPPRSSPLTKLVGKADLVPQHDVLAFAFPEAAATFVVGFIVVAGVGFDWVSRIEIVAASAVAKDSAQAAAAAARTRYFALIVISFPR